MLHLMAFVNVVAASVALRFMVNEPLGTFQWGIDTLAFAVNVFAVVLYVVGQLK